MNTKTHTPEPSTNDRIVGALTMLGRGDGLQLALWLNNKALMPNTFEARAVARIRTTGGRGDNELMRSIYASAAACITANMPTTQESDALRARNAELLAALKELADATYHMRDHAANAGSRFRDAHADARAAIAKV